MSDNPHVGICTPQNKACREHFDELLASIENTRDQIADHSIWNAMNRDVAEQYFSPEYETVLADAFESFTAHKQRLIDVQAKRK